MYMTKKTLRIKQLSFIQKHLVTYGTLQVCIKLIKVKQKFSLEKLVLKAKHLWHDTKDYVTFLAAITPVSVRTRSAMVCC